MYANLLALVLVIVLCRVDGYFVLRYLRRPQIWCSIAVLLILMSDDHV